MMEGASNQNRVKKAVCFGEVLWDLLPAGAVPGGAPMNVAIRLQSLGIETGIISRTGDDDHGRSLRSFLESKNVDTSLLQTDNTFPTGLVHVQLDPKGIATYDIVYPTAWDHIGLNELCTERVEQADAFIYGSLACRNDASRGTLFTLLEHSRFRVFDVNLRPPHYNLPLISELIGRSDFVKLNDDELDILATALGSGKKGIPENIHFLAKRLDIDKICVTRGKDGAVLFVDGQYYSHDGYKVKVADTVGSGDSFLAALVAKMLTGYGYPDALKYACAIGALVASKKGANPEISPSEIDRIITTG